MLRSESLSLGAAGGPIGAQWIELLEARHLDLSMAPQWFASTVRARHADEHARVFTVFDDDRLVAVAPYVARSESSGGVGARSRELPGSYLVAYHPDIVSSIPADSVLERFVADAGRDSDVVVLPNLVKDGETARALRELARRLGLRVIARPGHASPYLTIGASWDDFLKSKPKKFRYKTRTALADLEATAGFSNRWMNNAEDVPELLGAMLAIEARSWKAPAGMAVSDSAMETRYYESLLPFLAARNALHANVLYLGGEPVAYSLCYVTARRVRQLKTSFDERHSTLSVGAVAMRIAIQKAFESGAEEFDFLGDVMPHKLQWCSAVREHESIYLFLRSWRGLVVGSARSLSAKIRPLWTRPAAAKSEGSTAANKQGD